MIKDDQEKGVEDHSPICITQSMPLMDPASGNNPTINDVPMLDHPPLFVNSVNTAWADLFGASVQRVIIIANRPQMWTRNTMPSTNGSLVAKTELKKNDARTIPITRSVPCHA